MRKLQITQKLWWISICTCTCKTDADCHGKAGKSPITVGGFSTPFSVGGGHITQKKMNKNTSANADLTSSDSKVGLANIQRILYLIIREVIFFTCGRFREINPNLGVSISKKKFNNALFQILSPKHTLAAHNNKNLFHKACWYSNIK